MALEVVHQGGDGTTVPYGPLFDDIRKNRGFVDARGRPDIAASITEGNESAALRKLLIRISEENVYFSLGCDLGMHPEPEAKATLRQVAGGYIQVVGMDYELLSTDNYDEFNKHFERGLRTKSESRSWRIWLQGRYVNFKFPDQPPVMAPSIWIWFFARARTKEKAVASRESLIDAISDVLHMSKTAHTLAIRHRS
jgi:hypothetical protein